MMPGILLPCPKCGKKPITDYFDYPNDKWFVRCFDGNKTHFQVESDVSRDDAMGKWNNMVEKWDGIMEMRPNPYIPAKDKDVVELITKAFDESTDYLRLKCSELDIKTKHLRVANQILYHAVVELLDGYVCINEILIDPLDERGDAEWRKELIQIVHRDGLDAIKAVERELQKIGE